MEDRHEPWRNGIRWLSFYEGHAVNIRCAGCRFGRRYSVDNLLTDLGDVALQSLPVAFARAMKCDRVDKAGHMRCRVEIPYSAFEPMAGEPSPIEPPRLPADMYLLSDMALSDVPEWFILFGFCSCGYFRAVDVRRLRAKFAAASSTGDLARFLDCKHCNRKGNSVFTFRKMLRD